MGLHPSDPDPDPCGRCPGMADATAKKVLQLLGPEHPAELRSAAVRVLAAVGSAEAPVAQGLCAALDDPDPLVRLQALDAVGQLRVEAALPRLLAAVTAGGPESEAAAHAAARLGTKGTRALRELMGSV